MRVDEVTWVRIGTTVQPASAQDEQRLAEKRLAELWEADNRATVFGAVRPLIRGTGDIGRPHVEELDLLVHRFSDAPSLLVGDLALSTFEDNLPQE